MNSLEEGRRPVRGTRFAHFSEQLSLIDVVDLYGVGRGVVVGDRVDCELETGQIAG